MNKSIKKRKPNIIKEFICEKCGNKYTLKKTPNKGRLKLCGECLRKAARKRARNAKYYEKPKYKIRCRKWRLETYYGLSLENYETMLKVQNGVCAICGKTNGKKPLVVDHSHRLNKIRGLLCDKCNRAIGTFNDDPHILQKAILYLKDGGNNYGKN